MQFLPWQAVPIVSSPIHLFHIWCKLERLLDPRGSEWCLHQVSNSTFSLAWSSPPDPKFYRYMPLPCRPVGADIKTSQPVLFLAAATCRPVSGGLSANLPVSSSEHSSPPNNTQSTMNIRAACMIGTLFVWCLTAPSAKPGYIVL